MSSKKIVLITGGGTGLGLACAQQYAAEGHPVCIAGRRAKVLDAAIGVIKQRTPQAVVAAVTMDVRDPESVKRAVDELEQKLGGLPLIVLNNAAGNFISPSERLSGNAWRSIVSIVLFGSVNVTMEVGQRWIKVREGNLDKVLTEPQVVFMNVGASYVDAAGPFVAPSAAAKTAVWSMTRSLSVEWAKYGMRFFMVSPGPIYTEGAFSRLDPGGMMLSKAQDDPGMLQEMVPIGRLGTPEEYARFAYFLTSDACSWLTGTNINYDGGAHAGGGEFKALRRLPKKQWTQLENMIRARNKDEKTKSKL